MKKSLILVTIIIFSCTADVKNNEPAGNEPVMDNSKIEKYQTGWIDPDTYAVTASGADENDAINNAEHTILKDIVNVRVRNGSRYTDISKIRMEFDIPLREGKVIEKNTTKEGVTILFQIRGNDLKQKFERC